MEVNTINSSTSMETENKTCWRVKKDEWTEEPSKNKLSDKQKSSGYSTTAS